MSTKIGHFEILSELSKSATCVVYKANDEETGQTVALKAIQLSAFGESVAELQQCLLAEAETVKVLSHSNLTPVYRAAEIDGQFCAAMEYIQGNSIATMLARKEGFSIWDLLDIGRQVCGGLDKARSNNIFHFSLEPPRSCAAGTARSGFWATAFRASASLRRVCPACLQFCTTCLRSRSAVRTLIPGRTFSVRRHVLRDGDRPQGL